MYKRLLYIILIAIFIIGCSKPVEEEVVEEEPPPPPPTPEEIAAKIVNDLQLDKPLPAAGSTFDPGLLGTFTAKLKAEKAQRSATQDGKIALQIVSKRIDQRIRQCFNNELWSHTLANVELHLIMEPGSTKFIAEQTRAVAELKKPKVTIKAIISDGQTGARMAYLDIYLPLEAETRSESMKLGDQMYGIRFTEIIGNNQGIIFEYMETGENFEVFTKAATT